MEFSVSARSSGSSSGVSCAAAGSKHRLATMARWSDPKPGSVSKPCKSELRLEQDLVERPRDQTLLVSKVGTARVRHEGREGRRSAARDSFPRDRVEIARDDGWVIGVPRHQRCLKQVCVRHRRGLRPGERRPRMQPDESELPRTTPRRTEAELWDQSGMVGCEDG